MWGANISKNNKRGALAFLGLILIDLLRNIEFTKNVEGNILKIVDSRNSKKFYVFSYFLFLWVASQIFKGKYIHCQHCSHLIFSCSDRIGSCEIVFLAISRNALIVPDGWAGWRLMLVGVIIVATSSGMFNCCLCVSVYARTKGQCSKFWRRRPNRTFDLRTIVRQSAGKPVQRKYWSSTNIATNTG